MLSLALFIKFMGDLISAQLRTDPESGSVEDTTKTDGRNETETIKLSDHQISEAETHNFTSPSLTAQDENHHIELREPPGGESKPPDVHGESHDIDKGPDRDSELIKIVDYNSIQDNETAGEDIVTEPIKVAEAVDLEMSGNRRWRNRGRVRGGRSGNNRGYSHASGPNVDYLESQIVGVSLTDDRESEAGPSRASSRPTSHGREKTNNFPFFSDRVTIEHFKKSKVMFIMRGLPGSGKSTLVRSIIEVYPDAVACSADDYFLQPDGSYRYDRNLLSSAHEACQEKAQSACEDGCHIVIIDNTNVKMWEMSKYTEMASRCGYTVITVQPQTPWKFNPVELAKRNKHRVDVEIIRQKLKQFEEGIPYFYGWFLNENSSNHLRGKANAIFKACQRASDDFSYFISTFSFKPVEGNGRTNLNTIYGQTQSSLLHCTSFFSNRGRNSSASAYHNQLAVQAALGQTHTLEIIGFVFTPQTAGVRVKLDDNLLTLWGKNDHEGRASRRGAGGSNSRFSDAAFGMLDTVEQPGKRRRVSRFKPVVGEGSRAHMTLGFTQGTRAVQTGLDLVQVVEMEEQNRYTDESWDTDDGVLRCYMGQYWVVYLDEPIRAKAIFSGRY